jgi:hypothetical protein
VLKMVGGAWRRTAVTNGETKQSGRHARQGDQRAWDATQDGVTRGGHVMDKRKWPHVSTVTARQCAWIEAREPSTKNHIQHAGCVEGCVARV